MATAANRPRHNRTITVDFRDEATYCHLLGDGKAFLECVLAFLLALGFQLKHKTTCDGGGCLTRHSHYKQLLRNLRRKSLVHIRQKPQMFIDLISVFLYTFYLM